MKIDLLVGEIGSTTTVVNAFKLSKTPRFLGQGQAATTVLEGDVNIGLKAAIRSLQENIVAGSIEFNELIATSSAAGGLRMTVHGLVYDMTVKAAKEAALGAGANIKNITAGKLRESDLERIRRIKPNIILLAGGVDYGERDTALYNARLIRDMDLGIPIIYAGNIQNIDEIQKIFEGSSNELHLVDNVYPRIDELNVEPARGVIQRVFEKHIVHAPGMEKVRDMVTGPIMPTPGAVMEASKLLHEEIGNLVSIDVGGATTDIHSVTEDSEDIGEILLNPEPKAKRTVEGDLGVFINMENIVGQIGKEKLAGILNIDQERLEDLIYKNNPIPESDLEKNFVKTLSEYAVLTSMKRHGGEIKQVYGPSGKKTLATGKDLTDVKNIIATGGPLTRLGRELDILKKISGLGGNHLLPNQQAKLLVDTQYIMASAGVVARKYPEIGLELLKNSLKEE